MLTCFYLFVIICLIGDTMDKLQYKNIKRKFHSLCEREYTYLSVDNELNTVCKIFDSDFVVAMLDDGYDLEELVLEGSKLVNSDDIILPNSIVYNNKYFAGYLMPYFDGKSIYKCHKCYVNGYRLMETYHKLEDIIKKCDNIVFPDLLTDGNILVSDDLEIKLIDFDGLQIGEYSTPVFSRNIGDRTIYDNTKYKIDDLFTDQLNIKCLVYLYMKLLLGVDMGILDKYEGTRQKEMLNCFINDLGIDNDNLVNKILALYDDNKENIYLDNTVDEIYENYRTDMVLENGIYVKKLVRK